MAQRTREIRIRIALGADRGSVLRLALTKGFRLALAGVLLGTTAAVPALRLLEGQLCATSTLDPLSILGGVGTLLAVSLLASYLPPEEPRAWIPD
jgi:putative ABC transport system permease protein